MAIISNSLITPQYVRTASAIVTAANTTYSGTALPSGLVSIGPTGPNGSLLRGLRAIPQGTITATQLQLFKWNGTNLYFVDSQVMAAFTMSTTTIATVVDFGYTDSNPRYIGSGLPSVPAVGSLIWTYYVGIGAAQAVGIAFTAEYGDY